MKNHFLNIAAYKFVDLHHLAGLKSELLPFCQSLDLKGTILLSTEGINMFLAGKPENVRTFLQNITDRPEFSDIPVKESFSEHQPFSRMLVRLKKEIISMGVETIRPLSKTSPKISPAQLKEWLDNNKDLTLLDVRNDYEIEVGTFKDAVPAGIDHFRLFPDATKKLPEEMKRKPVVMFCTGGIRCEKAGPFMEEEGFEEIYQLDGGILKYFEDCGGEHYDGDCFVFDKRVAVDSDLKETDFEQCYGCQAVLSLAEQQSDQYDPPYCCPNCFKTDVEQMQELLEERDNLLAHLTTPLPGSIPYNNVRPLNVPLRYDRHSVIDFLMEMHGHLDRNYWITECEENRILYKKKPLDSNVEIRSGWRIEHHIPQTTEPPVNNDVRFVHEDSDLVIVNKPAPLPMHACGRFNRNSLNYFVNQVFDGEQIRILHRLDSNTTGVVVLARKKSAAQFIQPQFKDGSIGKVYLAKVVGSPEKDEFDCQAAISAEASTAGSRTVDESGLASVTKFKVLNRFDDGTTLVECHPKTGRTNQIRIHLSHLGFPILGDPTYEAGVDGKDKQTIDVDDPPMCLHALSIEFTHPTTKQRVKFETPLPTWAY
jgi:RluA family pseudouridine synthase